MGNMDCYNKEIIEIIFKDKKQNDVSLLLLPVPLGTKCW